MHEDTAERLRGRTASAATGSAPVHGVDGDGVEERSARYQRLRRELLDAERAAVLALRNDGVITEEVMQRVRATSTSRTRASTTDQAAAGDGHEPRAALDLQHQPDGEEAQQAGRAERPAVAAEPGADRAGAPRGERGAEHVRAEDPAEDDADAVAAEDLGGQRDGRRDGRDPVEPVEDDEEDQAEVR